MSGVSATAAVATRLAAVPNIGKVYDMLGNAVDEKGFRERFSDGTKIHAWEVTREASTASDEMAQAMQRTEQIVVYGYYSFRDGESEPQFQALVDTICDAFDPYRLRRFTETVDGEPVDKFDWSGPLQVDGPKFAMKGNYLVHFVRMVYPVRHFPIS